MKARFNVCVCLLVLAMGMCEAHGADRGLKVRKVLGEDVQLPHYHGLVIGINKYKHWRSLRQAREDAQSVAALLESRYGFESISTLYDEQATLGGIVRELRVLTRKLTPNDSLLIYFAGHGYYDKLLKKGYWIPSEGREQVDGMPAINDWLQNSNLKEYTDAMRARQVLVVSDSCFSGAMLRGGRVDIETRANTWYRRAISQPTRWCVASGDLETVPDQSVFAKKFLQALQYPRQSVFAASDLAGWIKNDVAAYSGRRPVFGPMNTASGSDVGEFIFLVQDDVSKPTPARAPAPVIQTQQPRAEWTQPRPQVVKAQQKKVKMSYGSLEIQTPIDVVIQIDGGTGYSLSAGKSLRWDKMVVGTHVVQATAGGRSWRGAARVFEGRQANVKVFPDEESRLMEEALQRARVESIARQAAEEAAARVAAQKKAEEEAHSKRHRPRMH